MVSRCEIGLGCRHKGHKVLVGAFSMIVKIHRLIICSSNLVAGGVISDVTGGAAVVVLIHTPSSVSQIGLGSPQSKSFSQPSHLPVFPLHLGVGLSHSSSFLQPSHLLLFKLHFGFGSVQSNSFSHPIHFPVNGPPSMHFGVGFLQSSLSIHFSHKPEFVLHCWSERQSLSSLHLEHKPGLAMFRLHLGLDGGHLDGSSVHTKHCPVLVSQV